MQSAIQGIANSEEFRISFELFPPKTEKALANFDLVVDRLAAANPDYVSVTYGAGGSTRERTRAAVDRVTSRTGVPISHHLTCVEATREQIDAQARRLWQENIRKLVALRGDPPEGGAYTPAPNGYAFAADLVDGLRRVADFEIAVAAYPETHPQAETPAQDLDNLKRKLDAGASSAITQFVFDTDEVLRFYDRARDAGIDAPISIGIMPVSNFASLKRFAAGCGAGIPDWLETMFEGLDANPDTRAMVAAAVATEQCRRLAAAGIKDFHFYTLNKADPTLAICHALGHRAAERRNAA